MAERIVLSERSFRLLLAAFAMLMWLAGAPVHAAERQVPGTRVTLDLPDGYRRSPEVVTGFVHPQLEVRIAVVESSSPLRRLETPQQRLDRAIGELESKSGYWREQLAKTGWRNPQPGKLKREDRYGYVRFAQSAGKSDEAVFVLVFGLGSQMAHVLAVVPQDRIDSGAVQLADIERVLESARIVSQWLEPPERFRLGSFKLSQVHWGLGRGLIEYEVTGPVRMRALLLPAQGDARAALMNRLERSFAVDQAMQKRRQQYSYLPNYRVAAMPAAQRVERFFMNAADVSRVEVTQRRQLRIAGLEGVELAGHGIDNRAANEAFIAGGGAARAQLGLYQVALEGSDGVYLILGHAPRAAFDKSLPAFRNLAESFALDAR